MNATIFLNETNHNGISLDGTLVEYMQGGTGSTLVMSGGSNWKKLMGLFGEIRHMEGEKIVEHYYNRKGATIKGSIVILCPKEGTETIWFPAPVRVHII